MMEFLSSYLEHVTILGLFFALLLAGLGIPIPEDLILITAGVLAYQGVVHLVSIPLMVGLGYFFADRLEVLYHDLRRVEHWLGALVILTITSYLLLRYRDTWGVPRQDSLSNGSPEQECKKVVNDDRP